MCILVTGGAGYIGMHTVKALKKLDLDCIVLDKNIKLNTKKILDNLEITYIKGDIADKVLVRQILNGSHPKSLKRSINGILHLAAYIDVAESCQEPIKYYANNTFASFSFFETIVEENRNMKKDIPLVFSSTCAVYGQPEQLPIKENNLINPINPYGKSKFFAEQFLNYFGKYYGLRSIIFRFFNAAGADFDGEIGEDHDPETHLIPKILEKIINNKNAVDIYGGNYDTKDGTCIRDFIHVCDLANAHIMALDYLMNEKNSKNNCKTNIFNLGTGKGYTVNEVIDKIEKIIGININKNIVERRAFDPPVLIACTKKIKDYLNWEPKYPEIEIIIKSAWKWHSKKRTLIS